MVENILQGQQAQLQALPRTATRNTERWLHSNRGCWDQKQRLKTPQQTALASRRALLAEGVAAAATQGCDGPAAVQRLADPVCVRWIPEADR